MRVVIVGGGFGGVRSALNLANKKGMEVLLISPQSFFEYHAALYRSATGRSPLEVAIPLRDFFAYAKNVEVVEDTVTKLDADNKKVTGSSGSLYQYDALILALGNVTEFYGIKGLRDHAFGVKTIHEALRLKRHLHEQLVNNESDRNYVVIGAGATGVELAAELKAYIAKILKKHKIKTSFTVDLVEAGPRVLSALPESFSRIVSERLHRLGVQVYLNTHVESESVEGITLPHGEILSHTVVWTAGVTNNPFFAAHDHIFQIGKSGRVLVDKFLGSTPDIYVIGDSADTKYSGMAQTALHDANFVTDNVQRRLRGKTPRTYKPIRPIYAVPVGPHWAAVLWGTVQLKDLVGWILRRLADLRLYLRFLPLHKALTTWRYGFVDEEVCPVCKQ